EGLLALECPSDIRSGHLRRGHTSEALFSNIAIPSRTERSRESAVTNSEEKNGARKSSNGSVPRLNYRRNTTRRWPRLRNISSRWCAANQSITGSTTAFTNDREHKLMLEEWERAFSECKGIAWTYQRVPQGHFMLRRAIIPPMNATMKNIAEELGVSIGTV